MSKEFDMASEYEQASRDKAVANIQQIPPAAEATGYCLECEKPIEGDLRWCDKDCRDDWQRWNPGA